MIRMKKQAFFRVFIALSLILPSNVAARGSYSVKNLTDQQVSSADYIGDWACHSGAVLESGASGSWDDFSVFTPEVRHDGTHYRMWYSGSDEADYRYQIGYASSLDGITWDKHPENPVLAVGEPGSWDDKWVWGATVLFDGSIWRMWYTGSSATSASHIGYATSQDGVIWQKHPENPVLSPGLSGDWDEDEVREPHVMLNEGIYKMWYGNGNQIGYATSIDGIDWEKHSGNPVLVPWGFGSYAVGHPTVIRLFDEFYMWYGSRELSRAGYEYYIQDAKSPDGISWSEHSYTGPCTYWSPFQRQPAVILRPTSAQMWYMSFRRIYFAEADLDFSSLDKTLFLPVIMR